MPKLKEPPLVADAVITVAIRKDLAFTLNPDRRSCPIPRTSPRVGYLTSQFHAGALRDTLDRHFEGIPGVFHYYLPRTATLTGWKSIPATIPMIVSFRSNQLIRACAVDAPRETMTADIRRKLVDAVDNARLVMTPQTGRELDLLHSLAPAAELDDEGLGNILLDDRGCEIVAGWPAWLLPDLPVDQLTDQAIRFIRSVADGNRK